MRRSPLYYPPASLSRVIAKYFGRVVSDPYRYMERKKDRRTKSWVTAQQEVTAAFFKPRRNRRLRMRKQLLKLWHYPKYSVLAKEGKFYFFWGLDLVSKNRVQNQSVLYRLDNLKGTPVSVIDPNLIDPSGNSTVNYQSISRNGLMVAYATSKNGGDWQTVRIRHTEKLLDYPEVLRGCKTVNIAWKADNSGFFYNRFVVLPGSKRKVSCIFYHEVNTPQYRDTLVYNPEKEKEKENQNQELAIYPETSHDGMYLVIYVTHGTEPHNQVLYRETESHAPFVNLSVGLKDRFVFIGGTSGTLYFQTSWRAPKGQIIAIDLARPEPEYWRKLVPEDSDILTFVSLAGGKLVAGYLHLAYHRLEIRDMAGHFENELEIPPFTTISGLAGRPDDHEFFVSLEGFTSPPSVYRYDFGTKALSMVIKPNLDFQSAEYETRQVIYPSHDGTPVPMFITHKKGLFLDLDKTRPGSLPTLLTAYGGFGLNQTPIFLISQALWLAQGGVLAVANIRGGGELGQDWHEGGRLANKQNTFSDFQAAARWLIEEGYTSPSRLGITGHSNGGLTVAASLVQTPELFGAAICQAPLTDMLRYHLVGTGRNWQPEYGSADSTPEEFEVLQAYSPLHNIRTRPYPATLVTVPLNDERVHPMHSFKFIANLQAHSTGDNPILIRVDEEGGHGLGNAASRTIEELCDIYTFLFWLFEMN